MAKAHTFNPTLHRVLIFLIKLIFKYRFPVKLKNPEILKEMSPPYILLPNHTMMWDVILIGLTIRHPIHYMATDAHFRNKQLGFLLKLVGTFPKAKAMNDLSAIRHMMSLKNQSKVICIYPEGQMTWDGLTLPPYFSTVKLLKLLKIPAYIPVLSGAYAVRPRWSINRRKGLMEMTIQPLETDGKAFKGEPEEEIYARMRSLMSGNEYTLIAKNQWHYKGKARAEHLENFLFICPECSALAALHSKKNTLCCKSCGAAWELDDQYTFHSTGAQGISMKNPGEWNEWQKGKLKELLSEYQNKGTVESFLSDENMKVKTGYRQEKPRLWTASGKMELHTDTILLGSSTGETRIIPFNQISGAHVLTRQRLEFYHNKTLYMFGFPNRRCSGYKWLCVLKTLGVPSSSAWASDEVQDS